MQFLPLLLSTLPLTLAAKQTVQVGINGLQFLPNSVTAQTGDTIEFQWASSSHSVTQSSYENPCSPLKGGIFSGTLDTSKIFTVTVNNTDPIWIYCAMPGHCQAGMVMAINPPSTGQNLDGYKAAAANAAPGAEPAAVEGGIVGKAGGTSTTLAGGTTSATSTTTGSTSPTNSASSGTGYGGSSGASKGVMVSGLSVFAGLLAWAL